MMHLSRVRLDNLDRRGWKVLSDLGDTHRFIMRAFPEGHDGDRVLFRVEPEIDGSRSSILVQSRARPDWSVLRDESPFATAACKTFGLTLTASAHLRFRLRANPTVKREGKRYGFLREEEARAWLIRKGEMVGFAVSNGRLVVRSEGTLCARRRHGRTASFQSYLFEGAIKVSDAAALTRAVESGIGSGKAFGFGLMSLAADTGE